MFYPISGSESFSYKTRLVGNLPDGNNAELENIKIIVPLKNLSNFMFNLNFLLINSRIELILKWSQHCVLTEQVTREVKAEIPAQGGNQLVSAVRAISRPGSLKFNIADCKLYVPVVTLQEKFENKLHEELKTGISVDSTWGKYRSTSINERETNNLNYLIDPTFNNVNRLFILAFSNEEDRSSFSKYFTPTVEIKDYNVLIDQQPLFEIPIKNKEETYKAITELITDGDFTTGNSLSYEYFCTHFKLIPIDLSKQNSEIENQQINFIGRLE